MVSATMRAPGVSSNKVCMQVQRLRPPRLPLCKVHQQPSHERQYSSLTFAVELFIIAMCLVLPTLVHVCSYQFRWWVCFLKQSVNAISVSMTFCGIQMEAKTVLELDFSPATPKQPQLVFALSLLDWMKTPDAGVPTRRTICCCSELSL